MVYLVKFLNGNQIILSAKKKHKQTFFSFRRKTEIFLKQWTGSKISGESLVHGCQNLWKPTKRASNVRLEIMGANGFLDAGNAGAVQVVIVLARLYELVVLYVRLHRLSIPGEAGLIFRSSISNPLLNSSILLRKMKILNYVAENFLSVFGSTTEL